MSLSCERKISRQTVLHDLVEHVVLPDARTIVEESRALERALEQLATAPSTEALAHARAAFARALLAWQRAQSLRLGPTWGLAALTRLASPEIEGGMSAGRSRTSR